MMLLHYCCAIFAFIGWTASHPQCLDYQPPFRPVQNMNLCYEYKTFGCCNDENDVQSQYNQIIDGLSQSNRSNCSSYIRAILCQKCSPYAAHLYFAESTLIPTSFPSLCNNYVASLVMKCLPILPSLNISLPITKFDPNYCYPEILNSNRASSLGQTSVKGNCLQLCVQKVFDGVFSPTSAKPANDGTNRMFVVEQRGVVWVYLSNFTKVLPSFLDIRSEVSESGRRFDERGLLDIAFHPNFSENGRFYLYFNALSRGKLITRLSEFRVSSNDMNRGNLSSERVIIDIPQWAANHNGGSILFLNGLLYLFTGDGGGANDPRGNGQNRNTLLGKALRLNVDDYSSNRAYGIPPDNPFVNVSNARDEVFAYGLRNPWRCTLDRGDSINGSGRGRIFCGDVGQGAIEEIDIIKKGANYGWNRYEGNRCFRNCGRLRKHERPIATYDHSLGESVTGGYVYRGCQSPNLKGKYIFGDWKSRRLFYLKEKQNGRWTRHNMCMGSKNICVNGGLSNRFIGYINSFAEDETGEVYILTSTTSESDVRGGQLYKLVDPSRRGNPINCQQRQTKQVIIQPGTRLIHSTTTRPRPSSAKPPRTNIRVFHPTFKPNRRRIYGQVEVKQEGGAWGLVCGADFRSNDVKVVCKQFGFPRGVAITRTSSRSGVNRIWLSNVRCTGSEASIMDCRHSGWGARNKCVPKRIANVYCYA